MFVSSGLCLICECCCVAGGAQVLGLVLLCNHDSHDGRLWRPLTAHGTVPLMFPPAKTGRPNCCCARREILLISTAGLPCLFALRGCAEQDAEKFWVCCIELSGTLIFGVMAVSYHHLSIDSRALTHDRRTTRFFFSGFSLLYCSCVTHRDMQLSDGIHWTGYPDIDYLRVK
jgi:hypothetical protein